MYKDEEAKDEKHYIIFENDYIIHTLLTLEEHLKYRCRLG